MIINLALALVLGVLIYFLYRVVEDSGIIIAAIVFFVALIYMERGR